MALVFLEPCITSYAKPPKVIVLDVDDTADRGHGQPEQARYDGYDGGYGCMPLHRYEGLSGRLRTTSLQAKRFTGAQMLAVLTRLVKHLRRAWPATLLRFRGDSHCASPEVRPWIAEPPERHDGTGVTSHAVLKELAQDVVAQAQRA